MITRIERMYIAGFLLGALLLAGAQTASANGFLPIGDGDDQPPWILSNDDTSDQSDVERHDGESECIDWDALFGLECPNDFPPGELPGNDPDDPGGPDDPTGGPNGPDGGIIVEDCIGCTVEVTPDGGVIIWVDDDTGGDTGGPTDTGGTGGTGGTGDTGSYESSAAEESQFAYQVFEPMPIDTVFWLRKSSGETILSGKYVVKGKVQLAVDGSVEYQILLRRLQSTYETPEWFNFTIVQEETLVRSYKSQP